jgi:hypothetical protein
VNVGWEWLLLSSCCSERHEEAQIRALPNELKGSEDHFRRTHPRLSRRLRDDEVHAGTQSISPLLVLTFSFHEQRVEAP